MAAGSRLADRAETAGAGRDHVDHRARRREERALARQMARDAVGRGQRDDGGRPGLAAEQAERRRRHALHAQRARRIGARQQAPDAPRAAAAAIAPGAAGVGVDLVALDAHREGHLQHLDRRVHGVGDAAGDDVDAVLVGARAEAALDRLVGDVAPARARIDAAEREDRRGALAAGHHLVRARCWPARPSPCRRRGARSRGWRRRRARETAALTTEPFGAFTSMVRQQPELGGMRLFGSTAILRPQIDARGGDRQRRVHRAL